MGSGSKRRKLSDGQYEASSPVPSPTYKESLTASQSGLTAPSVLEKKDDVSQRRSLFIRAIAPSVTTQQLTEHFSQSFALKHATIVLDPQTKVSRGFGFVTFLDAEDAQTAMAQFNGSELGGKKLRVEIAERRHREIGEDVLGKRLQTTNVKAEEMREARRKQMEQNRPPKLIIRNLPWSIADSESLEKLFLSYGKVKSAVVGKGKNGKMAGFGFVVLRGKKNAEKALEGVNGKEIDGRVLAVDWAVEKETWEKSQQQESDDLTGDQEEVARDGVSRDKVPTEGLGIDGDEGEDQSEAVSKDDTDDDEDDGIDEPFGGSDTNSDIIEDEAGALLLDEEIASTELTSGEESPSLPSTSEHDDTVFIRNLPFTTDDDSLYSHFKTHFGPVRYARVVFDRETERPKGTAFVAFYKVEDAKSCVVNAPKPDSSTRDQSKGTSLKRDERAYQPQSILQNDLADPSGRYTLDGRILSVTRALSRDDATKRMNESAKKRDHDKRRLYLLSEGTISKGSALYNSLGKTEIDIRESSARQRQKLVRSNPNLCLSTTRLSIRNLPRTITSKDLKALAREAIVGFAKDVKAGLREPLSKDEIARAQETSGDAEKLRKGKGKGVVKQAKIVFESTATGGKVAEGKGRSRGYGFVEYHGHRHALMGLRWLNGHLVKAQKPSSSQDPSEMVGERSKRLIVEFAIENAQVVQRRAERELRARNGTFVKRDDHDKEHRRDSRGRDMRKRKRSTDDAGSLGTSERGIRKDQDKRAGQRRQQKVTTGMDGESTTEEKNKVAMRNRIIGEKRKKRRMRKSNS